MVLDLWLDKLLWHKWSKSWVQALDTRVNILFLIWWLYWIQLMILDKTRSYLWKWELGFCTYNLISLLVPSCPNLVFRPQTPRSGYGIIILNRSNNSVFLYLKICWNWQVCHLIRASGISMKPKTLCHQASSSKF